MAKSKVIDGFSYEFDSLGKIIAVFDHSDPTNPAPVDPESKLYSDQVTSNDALTAFNFNRYGGNKDSYEDSVELPPSEVAKAFYDKEVKDNKERLEEQNDAGLSNPSLAPGPASAYASYKRGQKTGNTDLFTYPLDIDPKQDHLKISKYKYARNEDSGVESSVQGSRPTNVDYQNVNLTKGDRLGNVFRKEEDRVKPVRLQKVVEGDSMLGNQLEGSVMLPMPKVVDTNGCEWGESEVNIFGLAALGAFEVGKNLVENRIGANKFLETDALQGVSKKDLLAVEKITARGSVGKDMIKNFKQGGSALLNAAAAEATARVTGQSISQDQILARTSGRVLNPNAELLFQGPVLRDFNFDFLMIARSEKEGKEIRKIIRWFKQGMAPKFNSATFLETPNVFTLEYKNGTRPGDVLKTVNRFSPGGLALRTIAVDYAPSGYWSAYQDSQPVAIKMSLNFAELRPIYEQDQAQNGLVDTVGY
jgi:hypothetical protein